MVIMKSVFLGIYFTCTTRPLRFCHIALVSPPHDHIKRQIKLARNSISNSDSFSRSLTATSISALVLSLSRSGQGQSFRLGRPHVRIAGGNLCMGGVIPELEHVHKHGVPAWVRREVVPSTLLLLCNIVPLQQKAVTQQHAGSHGAFHRAHCK